MPSQDTSTCANPLLLEWVKEWLDDAKQHNTKGVTTYNRAYKSLKDCPIAFTHPCELKQLTGFGDTLCKRLTDKLQKYCEEQGVEMPAIPGGKKKAIVPGKEDDNDAPIPAKKAKKIKPYVPALRSGAYAIILALATLDEDAPHGITKGETIELAQEHCDSSFTAPSDPTKFYTAWASMKTLLDKDLVHEKGRPLKRYRLTDDGWEVAKRIMERNPDANLGGKGKGKAKDTDEDSDCNDELVEFGSNSVRLRIEDDKKEKDAKKKDRKDDKVADIVPQGETISDESSLPTFSPITIQPWAFTVEFVLDVREIRATKDRDYMENELIKRGVKPTMKSMDLGDALWVAKCKDPQLLSRLGAEGDEIMLDWIVERKRLDDLVGSIKDGRFHEQKFRLKKSGVKNIIYIIEEIKVTDEHIQRYSEAVESAIASTQVVNGFFVKKTQKMDDTIRYLARMTALLKNIYENKPLQIIPTKCLTAQNHQLILKSLTKKQPDRDFHITYPAFASLASKSDAMTLRDYYLKMLMCTRGVTGEKALEIQKRWKTPIEFVEAFQACGDDGDESKKRKRELVSSKMGALMGRKKIAGSLSAKIAENWAGVPPLR